jgi:hypothetical protein
VIIASIVEFVRNQNAIRSYDRASSFVLRLKSKLRCGLEGDLFYQPWMAETTTAMIAILADWLQAYLYCCMMRLLVGGHYTKWDLMERVYLVQLDLQHILRVLREYFLRPRPISLLNLRAHLSQWHLLLSTQVMCRMCFTCDRTWPIVFELRENCELYFDTICKWTYQHEAGWNYHGFDLSSPSVEKGSLIYRNKHHRIQPAIISAWEQDYGR